MKVAIPYADRIIDTENGMVNTLVIENQRLFSMIIEDIYRQTTGEEGRVVVSEANKPCNVAKKIEVLNRFVPFEVNTRTILSHLNTELEKISLTEEYYEESMKMLSELENLIIALCSELPFEISITKLNMGALIKSLGVEINQYIAKADKKFTAAFTLFVSL